MNRRELVVYLSVLGLGAGGFAAACSSLSPYPSEDPLGPYKAGEQGGTIGIGGTPVPEGGSLGDGDLFGDGELGEGGPPPLCTGCALVATASDPQSLALDGSNIYWAQGTNTGGVPVAGTGSIVSVARPGGGSTTTVAPGLTGPVIVKYANSWLGWSATTTGAPTPGMSSVSLIGTSGGTPTTPGMAQNGAYGVALDATNLYWVSIDTSGDALVQSSPLSGGGVSMLGSTTGGALTPLGMAVNADSIYFVAYGGGGGLFQLPLTGGTPTQLWTGSASSHPTDVAVDGSNVYWVDYATGSSDGAVYAMPLGGGAVTTMATGINGPFQIAVDSANVYFTAVNGGIVYEEAIGATTPSPLVMGLLGPQGIAADNVDSNVYFTDNTVIYAHPK